MDKLITTNTGGFPFQLDDLRWITGQYSSSSRGIYQALEYMLSNFGSDYIVAGCLDLGFEIMSQGFIMLNNQLVGVDVHGRGSNTHFALQTPTYQAGTTKTFQDGSLVETYQKNRAAVTAMAGTLAYNGLRLEDVIFNKRNKIIEIGDWNMSTADGGTHYITVAHGLTDFTKIRSVSVMIKNDLNNLYSKLETSLVGDGSISASQGHIRYINSTYIELIRLTGGHYDNAQYKNTSYNRGWVTISFDS